MDRAQRANAMHIPSITRLMLYDDPELQLSPEQQFSITVVLHDSDDVGQLGKSWERVPQLDIFGALHLL